MQGAAVALSVVELAHPVPYTPGEGGVGTIGETIAEALEIIEVRGRDAIMRQALRQRTPRTQCRRMPRSCDRSSAITRCSGHSTSTSSCSYCGKAARPWRTSTSGRRESAHLGAQAGRSAGAMTGHQRLPWWTCAWAGHGRRQLCCRGQKARAVRPPERESVAALASQKAVAGHGARSEASKRGALTKRAKREERLAREQADQILWKQYCNGEPHTRTWPST